MLSIFNAGDIFKAVPGISCVSQNGIMKLFTIIKHQFDESVIDSKNEQS